jgi:hypothetical protein
MLSFTAQALEKDRSSGPAYQQHRGSTKYGDNDADLGEVGVRLVITKKNVVARRLGFYKVALKQKRLGL